MRSDLDAKTAAKRCESLLLTCQSKEGWWPYRSGGGPSLEASSWCLLPLMENSMVARTCCQFLARVQNDDGGWSTAPGAGSSDWVSGPVLLALRSAIKTYPDLRGDAKIERAVYRGVLYLADSRIEPFAPIGRLLLLLWGLTEGQGAARLMYSRGWPWDPHCHHWVEPTSYNLLAIKIPGHPNLTSSDLIVKFANQFLTRNACRLNYEKPFEYCGWNHGNAVSTVSGTEFVNLPPFRLTTAEALLALQDIKDHPTIEPALQFLKSQAGDDSSALSLAWSILALDAFGQKYEQELSYLLARQKDDGSFADNFMVNGMALSALLAAQGKNPFRLVLDVRGS